VLLIRWIAACSLDASDLVTSSLRGTLLPRQLNQAPRQSVPSVCLRPMLRRQIPHARICHATQSLAFWHCQGSHSSPPPRRRSFGPAGSSLRQAPARSGSADARGRTRWRTPRRRWRAPCLPAGGRRCAGGDERVVQAGHAAGAPAEAVTWVGALYLCSERVSTAWHTCDRGWCAIFTSLQSCKAATHHPSLCLITQHRRARVRLGGQPCVAALNIIPGQLGVHTCLHIHMHARAHACVIARTSPSRPI
jgi:hypothetical protein